MTYITRQLTGPQARALRLLGKHDISPSEIKQHGFTQSVAFSSLVGMGYAKFGLKAGVPHWSLTHNGRMRLSILLHRSEALADYYSRLNQRITELPSEPEFEQPATEPEFEQPAPLLALPAPQPVPVSNYTDTANLADAIIMSLDDIQRHMDLLRRATEVLKASVTTVTKTEG